MKKFEYLVKEAAFNEGDYNENLGRKESLYRSPGEMMGDLLEMGAGGWELCSVFGSRYFIFKREVE